MKSNIYTLLGIFPSETKPDAPTKIYPRNVDSSFVLNHQNWKPPRCPSSEKWIKKLWNIHTRKYYLAIKGNSQYMQHR